MRPNGYTTDLDGSDRYGRQAVKKLKQKPKPQHKDSTHPGRPEKQTWKQHLNLALRKHDQVGTQDARNGAASAYARRCLASPGQDDMRQRGHNANPQVEDQINQLPQRLFDFVAKDMQIG